MEKYLVVTDSTSALDKENAKKYNIELVSLSVIDRGKEYKDQVDISTDEFYTLLKEGEVPSTSQPNTGYLVELMEGWKKENYEAILVFTCSCDLSGTNNGFHLAADTVGLDNITIYDTRSIGAPVMDMAIRAKRMADEGASVEEIVKDLDKRIDKSFSFLYPNNFTQLSKSGRLSPAAARVASLFKIRALLSLEDGGRFIDKYALCKTELKIFKNIISKFKEDGVNSQDYKIYILHADNTETASKLELAFKAAFMGIEIETYKLPPVLTAHGGMKCVAAQYVYKGE
ncbi:MAG: DegV family protein [Thomasclavelia sp.]|jgi:DegV family protein with EDD domain|nr:DegV family protein [Thomasclavelia sp.]